MAKRRGRGIEESLRKLEEEKKVLEERLSNRKRILRETSGGEHARGHDRNGSTEAIVLISITEASGDREVEHLIEAANRRKKEGTYGICTVCEEGISAKRLKAVPWAERCLTCKTKEEEGDVASDVQVPRHNNVTQFPSRIAS